MATDKEIGERLAQARKGATFSTATEAAAALGMKYPTYAGHENGSRGLRANLERYAKRFGVSVDWLLTGKGSGPAPGIVTVPLLTWISAGAMMREDVSDEALGDLLVSDLPPGDWIALKVVGDSMDRISPPESTIFVDRKDKELVPNALYVIADEEGNATYKRFRPGPPRRFEPVSVNTAHEPIIPDRDPVIVGRVKRSVLDAM